MLRIYSEREALTPITAPNMTPNTRSKISTDVGIQTRFLHHHFHDGGADCWP